MCQNSNEPAPTSIDDLPENRFVEGWTAIVGEPPSIMLDRHHAMIAVLVETVPAEPDDGPRPGWTCRAAFGRSTSGTFQP